MREEQPLDHFDGQSYLTLAEVCRRYGMSSKTLRDRCDQGIFPAPLSHQPQDVGSLCFVRI